MSTNYDTVTIPAEEYERLRAARSAQVDLLEERCHTYERSLKAVSRQQERTEAARAEMEKQANLLRRLAEARGVELDRAVAEVEAMREELRQAWNRYERAEAAFNRLSAIIDDKLIEIRSDPEYAAKSSKGTGLRFAESVLEEVIHTV